MGDREGGGGGGLGRILYSAFSLPSFRRERGELPPIAHPFAPEARPHPARIQPSSTPSRLCWMGSVAFLWPQEDPAS